MKTYIKLLVLLVFLLGVIFSCSKEEGSFGCAAQYIAPTFKFNVVSVSNGNDLFFSTPPVYATTAIKIYFKNQANKIDSISPSLEETGTTGKYFVYSIPTVQAKDTCFVKINGVLSNTIYYTTTTDNPPCNTAIINSIKIDNNDYIGYKTNDIITIKK
jgi:hypothetical protein